MQFKIMHSIFAKKSFFVLLSGVLCTMIMVFVMRLWQADINFAFIGGSGDSALELMGIQNLLETGTRNLSDRLGGMWGQQLYDYPVADALNYGIMRIFSIFTQNPAIVMNLFFLTTFPLAAMTAMLTLLELDISRTVSMMVSLLFPFMSYHFLRNQSHLLLSAYYMVPLGLLVVFWLMQGKSNIIISHPKSLCEHVHKNHFFLFSVIICILISSSGLYYAYFTCFFILLAVIKSLFSERRWSRNTSTGLIYLILVCLGVAANYLPAIIFHLSGGERADAVVRPGESAEIYGLKLIDLFMPTIGHRIASAARLVGLFHASEPTANENVMVSLGALGSVGFAILLLIPIIRFRQDTMRIKIVKNASFMAYAGLLLAFQGGVSALICRLVFSGIRAYNRICVFLFFLALVTMAVVFDTMIQGRSRLSGCSRAAFALQKKPKSTALTAAFNKHRRWLSIFLIPLIILSLYDQIPTSSVFSYAANKQTDLSTQAYFQAAEASVPEGTYVYQLPYTAFPEPTISFGSGPYSQLTGYLNTYTLHWSYGAMAGTLSARWSESVSKMPGEEMLLMLKESGYGAVCIDLLNYPDDSLAALKDKLLALTGSTPIISEDGKTIFFAI